MSGEFPLTVPREQAESAQAGPSTRQPPRRSFLKRAVTGLIGIVLTLFPVLSGLIVFLDPLRNKTTARGKGETGGAADGFRKVTNLESLPDDGTPQTFRILADRQDAWTFWQNVPIGSVFLRKVAENEVQAFHPECPHLSCFVGYNAGRNKFVCPCHNSAFELDGDRMPGSPSPRDLDSLHVEIRNGHEVWVKYQEFRTGTEEKIPVA